MKTNWYGNDDLIISTLSKLYNQQPQQPQQSHSHPLSLETFFYKGNQLCNHEHQINSYGRDTEWSHNFHPLSLHKFFYNWNQYENKIGDVGSDDVISCDISGYA